MKILFITTISNTINAFLIPHITFLVNQGFEIDVACNIVHPIDPTINELGCKIHKLDFQRTPYSVQNIKAYKDLVTLLDQEQYDIVHTHTPIASLWVRLACRKKKNIKVIYTAHGFHFYKGAPLINWLFYYPIEYLLSWKTDILITINSEDYTRAQKYFKATKISLVPGVGLDVKKYNSTVVDKWMKRNEFGIPKNAFLVVSVGELNKNKNHSSIIRAIASLNDTSIHYIICGEGEWKSKLVKLSINLGVSDQIHFLGFRTDIAEICKVSDIFVFPSFREGLGLAALEAMASGLPIITSNVHGIVDYSQNEITGYNCSPYDIAGFANNILRLKEDKTLREKMGKGNAFYVSKYDTSNVLGEIMKLYKTIT